MEDDFNIFPNGRQPELFGKWKTTSIIGKWNMTQLFRQMEDYINILVKESQHQFPFKLNVTSN